jgi:hypothetical protein
MSDIDNAFSGDFVEHLANFIGETVTIFATSGGESGSGFTGVLLFVNNCFVRLITCIGPPPECPLGNGCDSDSSSSKKCKGDNGLVRTVGSVTDIPIDRIAAFVHNAT